MQMLMVTEDTDIVMLTAGVSVQISTLCILVLLLEVNDENHD